MRWYFLAHETGCECAQPVRCLHGGSGRSECLTDSVDMGPEGCSVRGEGFESCLFFKLDVRVHSRAF